MFASSLLKVERLRSKDRDQHSSSHVLIASSLPIYLRNAIANDVSALAPMFQGKEDSSRVVLKYGTTSMVPAATQPIRALKASEMRTCI